MSQDGIVGWAIGMMEAIGAPGAGVAIAAENLFPPLPSEVLLPLAGFTASQGSLSLYEVLLWTTLGSLAGALVLYAVGALIGRHRVRAIAARLPLVDLSDIDKAEDWFARHGAKAVFFGRMIPIVRSLISVPAGVERMRPLVFAGLTLLGSAIWNTAFVLAGYQLGEQYHLIERYAGFVEKGVIGIVALAVVAFVVVRLKARRSRPQEPQHREHAAAVSRHKREI